MTLHRNYLMSFAWLCALCWPGAAVAFDLLQLYQYTLASNPALKARQYAIDRAKAQQDGARSKLLPQLSASGNRSWNDFEQDAGTRDDSDISATYSGTRAIVQARQALFDLPSLRRLQGAGHAVKQSEQELDAARLEVTSDLIDRYFAALEASDEIDIISGEKALTQGDMQRIRRMRERQLATVTDLYEIEAYFQALLTREIEAHNAKAIALEKLRETTGVSVALVAPLARDRLPEVTGELEQWIEESLRTHPALLALQQAMRASEKLVAGARAEHLPQLSLQMSETYVDNSGFDNRQQPPYNIGTIGVQLNMPIYLGGSTQAGVGDALARYHIAFETWTQKRREIERRIRAAYLSARAGQARMQSTAREVEAREKARDAQQKSYQLGVTTVVALLEAKKNLLQAHSQQARARYDYIRALVALRLWVGNLDLQDIEAINSWLVTDRDAPRA